MSADANAILTSSADSAPSSGQQFSADFNEVWRNRPAAPVSDRTIEVSVVHEKKGGVRCVYVNDRRVAGGKPYVSEGLSSTRRKTKISDVLDAFTDAEIKAYLAEQAARRDYIRTYHAWKACQPSEGTEPAPPSPSVTSEPIQQEQGS